MGFIDGCIDFLDRTTGHRVFHCSEKIRGKSGDDRVEGMKPLRLVLIIASLAAGVILSVILGGCDSFKGKSAIPDDRVVIEFWHGMGGPLGEVLDKLIAEYNQMQTRYYVRGISMGSYDTLQKKILASVVARRSPDISQNFESLTLKLSKAGKIICLDDWIEKEPDPAAFRSDIIPVMLENNTFDGKIWSFPFNKSVPVLYYNKDLFQASGLDPESPPKTIDELGHYSQKLTRDLDGDGRPDIVGFAFTLRNEWNWACRLASYGGELYDPESRTVFLESPENFKAISSYSKMLLDGIAKFAEGYDHQNEWLAGKLGMFEASIVSRIYLKGKIKFNHGVAPVPYGDRPAPVLSGTNINVFDNKDPARIEGSWDFIRWFTSTEVGARWSLESTYLPVRKSSLHSSILQNAFEADSNLRAPYEQVDSAIFEPRIPEWFECRIKISDELEQIYIKTARIKDNKGSQEEHDKVIREHMKNMQKKTMDILQNSLDL